MTDIVAFLTARLDEDERTARAVRREDWADFDGWAELGTDVKAHSWAHSPASVLRDVAAKREIIRAHEKFGLEAALVEHKGYDALNYHRNQAVAYALNVVLRYLALAYDNHPDYDPAWKLDAPH